MKGWWNFEPNIFLIRHLDHAHSQHGIQFVCTEPWKSGKGVSREREIKITRGGVLVRGVSFFSRNRGSRGILIWSRLARNCLWMTLWLRLMLWGVRISSYTVYRFQFDDKWKLGKYSNKFFHILWEKEWRCHGTRRRYIRCLKIKKQLSKSLNVRLTHKFKKEVRIMRVLLPCAMSANQQNIVVTYTTFRTHFNNNWMMASFCYVECWYILLTNLKDKNV